MILFEKWRKRKILMKLKYCYVTGGKRNFNFHGWLSKMTIERLINEGCNVKVIKHSK